MNGRLDLHFSKSADTPSRTRLAVDVQQPPLRVIRSFPLAGGGVLTHLHNVSGGILGGDQLTLRACLEPDTVVQLTSTGATRVYRHRAGRCDALQSTHFQIGEGALLEYLPDPLIPFAAARFQQQTVIDLAPNAGLFYWEVIAPGREAHGERFAYDEVTVRLDIRTDEQPIALEQMRLQPAIKPLTSKVRMGDYRYLGTFYICKVGVTEEAWLRLEGQLMELVQLYTVPGEIVWGISTMVAHGLTIRALSMTNRAITDGLLAFWDRAKQALYGVNAEPPRKVY